MSVRRCCLPSALHQKRAFVGILPFQTLLVGFLVASGSNRCASSSSPVVVDAFSRQAAAAPRTRSLLAIDRRSFVRRPIRLLASASAADSSSMSQNNNDSDDGPHLVLSVRDHMSDFSTGRGDGNYECDKIRLILASQSPRRREILDMMGLRGKFEARPSPLDEAALQLELQCLEPVRYTRQLAEGKALALARSLQDSSSKGAAAYTRGSTLVLGSDTVVALDGHKLEKPVSTDDAKRMLCLLQGRHHQVHTGVALVRVDDSGTATSNSGRSQPPRLVTSFADTADVVFSPLSASDIDAYVATGEPMDKAGSYGIQGIGGQLVSSVQGDFFTVMGLPMHKTSRALADAITEIMVSLQQD
jgi:septum formation protein